MKNNNSIGNNNNITVGNNMNFTNKQNKENNINRENINKNIKIPKRISKEEMEKLMKITMRPNLKDKLGQHIECFGFIVCKYKDVDSRYTVINVIDTNGNTYTADHIQLDLKENMYDYSNDRGQFIRFEGTVISYPKNNSVDYTVDITSKVKIMSSIMLNLEGDYSENGIDYDKINNYLYRSNMTNIYNLIDKIKEEINHKTEGFCSKDFIYYYIINQFYLNQATYYIYEGNLRDQGFSGESILNILILLSNVLYELTNKYEITLYYILKLIAQGCNIIQGVVDYDNIDNNPKLKLFIRNYIGKDTGKKRMKRIWSFILYRYFNFNEPNPNVNKWDEQDLITRSYMILDEYI